MKMNLMNVEHVSEVAKDLTWEGNFQALSNSIFVWGNQLQRVERLVGKVEFIITDSPLILGIFYASNEYPESYKAMIVDLFKKYDNMNYFVNRVKPYNPQGRNQSAKEAEKLSKTIHNALNFYNVPFKEIDGDETGLAQMYKDVTGV